MNGTIDADLCMILVGISTVYKGNERIKTEAWLEQHNLQGKQKSVMMNSLCQ